MLKYGDEGNDVRTLVDKLRELGFSLAATNRFDSVVKKSVEAFQVANVDASGQPLEVDGKVGPHTRWAMDAAAGHHEGVMQPTVMPGSNPGGGSPAGQGALAIALRESSGNHGESGSDNHGPDIIRYLNGKAQEGVSWCAAFVSYCFLEALHHDPVFGYQIGAQAIHNQMKKLGYAYDASLSSPPQPGDIIVWRRVDPGNPSGTQWQGHVGIVHGYSDGILWTIEGNRGPYPSTVNAFHYSWSSLVTSAKNDAFKGIYGLSRHP